MKGFKIIEAGRLDKQQMSLVIGGGNVDCKSDGTKRFWTGDGVVNCPIKYRSCEGISNKLLCSVVGGYEGPPGSAGFGEIHDINL